MPTESAAIGSLVAVTFRIESAGGIFRFFLSFFFVKYYNMNLFRRAWGVHPHSATRIIKTPTIILLVK